MNICQVIPPLMKIILIALGESPAKGSNQILISWTCLGIFLTIDGED